MHHGKGRVMTSVNETYNNKVVNRLHKSAWVQAGTAVTATSASEAAKQAGLDWTVSLEDLYAEHKVQVSEWDTITSKLPVPNRVGVVKTATNGDKSVIGVVGGRYKTVQNIEVFNALDTLVDSGDARYAAAGEYKGGSNIWMVMELPKGVNVADDPHAAFLLVKSSHDGSCAVVIKPIIERLWCANQINRLITGKNYNKYTYKLKHWGDATLSVSDIRNITALTYSSIEEYEATAAHLLSIKVSRENAVNYFKKVWALPPALEDTPSSMLLQGQRRAQTIAFTARSNALDIYMQSQTQENIRGTAFGMWQAVIEQTDHYKGRDTAKRAVSAISGTSDAIKTKALTLVLA